MTPRRVKTEGEILEEIEADVNVPWLYRWTKISHYYGDTVRALLISCAVLMLVTAPFYADDIKTELPFIVLGAVAMVCAAALTSPWKRGFISADAVAAGVGLVVYENWALSGYETDPIHQFVLREAIAILCLFALYFSTKTLRSMLLDKIGQPDSPREFESDLAPLSRSKTEQLNWKLQAHQALEEVNEHEKLEFND